MSDIKNKRICECCHGTYATGKKYGEYWCQFPELNLKVKGLCEFCNLNQNKWFTSQMKICNNHQFLKEKLK